MKHFLSRFIPVHFTAHYGETMGTSEHPYEVQRTAKWWQLGDKIWRHYVSV